MSYVHQTILTRESKGVELHSPTCSQYRPRNVILPWADLCRISPESKSNYKSILIIFTLELQPTRITFDARRNILVALHLAVYYPFHPDTSGKGSLHVKQVPYCEPHIFFAWVVFKPLHKQQVYVASFFRDNFPIFTLTTVVFSSYMNCKFMGFNTILFRTWYSHWSQLMFI